MNLKFSTLLFTLVLLGFSNVASAHVRDDVNFAFGGATTNSFNATDFFAAFDPNLAGLVTAIRDQNLDLIGVSQQLEFAVETLNDVDPEHDLFWVYGGTNNYLAGEQDPAIAPAQLGDALERLYSELGARRFVVPNLPALGDLPFYLGQTDEIKNWMTVLTTLHNQNLAAEIADFEASHSDATVIQIDVFSIFQAHKVGGEFDEVIFSCDMIVPPEQIAVPGACDGFLYLDIVHPISAAWTPVAEAVAGALAGTETDRIITIGDSFSDLGSMYDTFERTVGFGFPPPPFTGGRFTEAENVIEKVEALIEVAVPSRPFSQPFRDQVTYMEKSTKEGLGSVFIPKQLSGSASKLGAKVALRFQTEHCPIICRYLYDGESTFHFSRCNRWWLQGGDRLDASNVRVKPKKHVDSVTVNWLYY